MYADTLEELHAMARQIGLKPAWFQDRINFPHYDLTASKRASAVQRGAMQSTRHHVVLHMRRG
jgi:Protein of unknown function (DUF4031)